MASLLEIAHREGITQRGGSDTFSAHPRTTAQPRQEQRDSIGRERLPPFREEDGRLFGQMFPSREAKLIQVLQEDAERVFSKGDLARFQALPGDGEPPGISVEIPQAQGTHL